MSFLFVFGNQSMAFEGSSSNKQQIYESTLESCQDSLSMLQEIAKNFVSSGKESLKLSVFWGDPEENIRRIFGFIEREGKGTNYYKHFYSEEGKQAIAECFSGRSLSKKAYKLAMWWTDVLGKELGMISLAIQIYLPLKLLKVLSKVSKTFASIAAVSLFVGPLIYLFAQYRSLLVEHRDRFVNMSLKTLEASEQGIDEAGLVILQEIMKLEDDIKLKISNEASVEKKEDLKKFLKDLEMERQKVLQVLEE